MFKNLSNLFNHVAPSKGERRPLCDDNIIDELRLCKSDQKRRDVWQMVFDQHNNLPDLISWIGCGHTGECSCLRPFGTLSEVLDWLSSATVQSTTGTETQASAAMCTVKLEQEKPICTQQNYGKLEVIDNKKGWAWEKCSELGRYSEAQKTFVARSPNLSSLINSIEIGSTINPRDVLSIQRQLHKEFAQIREHRETVVFDADDEAGPLDSSALGTSTRSASLHDTDPIWFTYTDAADSIAGEIAIEQQSFAASRIAAKHRYAAGMYRARDSQRDVMGPNLLDSADGSNLGAKLHSILSFRTMVHIRITPRIAAVAAQPTALSSGDHYMFRTRPSSEQGGIAVRLAEKRCKHPLDCNCGAPGLPEFLVLPKDIATPNFVAEIDAIVVVSVRSLSQYFIPDYNTIIRKNPRLETA